MRDAVSCAPRQRALGPGRAAGRPPPGQPESQLQPPGSWARQRGSRLSAKLCRVKTFQYLIYQSCRGLYY
jgi:hypothetical protein